MIKEGQDLGESLEEIQLELAKKISLLYMVVAFIGIWYCLSRFPFPLPDFLILCALLGLNGLVRSLVDGNHLVASRILLAWGSVIIFSIALIVLPYTWLPYLGLVVPLTSTILSFPTSIVTTLVICAEVITLSVGGMRGYSLEGFLVTMLVNAVSTIFVFRSIYNAQDRIMFLQQNSYRLLEETRKHRGDLSRSLKSVQLANDLLRRTQNELAFARQQADQAKKMKEQFAANISHELRTPLSLILGFSELMHLKPEVYGAMQWPVILRRDVYQIYNSSRHLMGMIDDILDLSRFEMTGFKLNWEETDINSLLTDTIDIASGLFRGQAIQLELVVEPDLPAIEIDRTRIRQVVLNIFGNAQRYVKKGTVKIEAKRRKSDILISISDTGPGIPEEKIPHLFEEFYQADSSIRRQDGGVGLGLAISKRFIEAHGGTIWAESELGVGSTFYFTIPIVSRLFHYHESQLNQGIPFPAVRPCVLLVDQDITKASLIRHHFQDLDVYQVEPSTDVNEAISQYQPRAVVVCSPAVSQQIQPLLETKTPLILCALPGQYQDRSAAESTPALMKPLSPEKIRAAIQDHENLRSVLIVDDDRGVVQLIERVIQSENVQIQIIKAFEGSMGVRMIATHHPDLVFWDNDLPGWKGTEIINKIQHDEKLNNTICILLGSITDQVMADQNQNETNILEVHRPGGAKPIETIRCLNAVVNALDVRITDDPGMRNFKQSNLETAAGSA